MSTSRLMNFMPTPPQDQQLLTSEYVFLSLSQKKREVNLNPFLSLVYKWITKQQSFFLVRSRGVDIDLEAIKMDLK